MGAIFRLEHANIVAYMTSRSSGAPRVRRRDLHEYIGMLANSPREYLLVERPFAEDWPMEISRIARKAEERLSILERRDARVTESELQETVAPAQVESILEELRSEFSGFPLYALAVGEGSRFQDVGIGVLTDKGRELAHMPLYGQLLVLLPMYDGHEHNLEVLDPVPVFSRALHFVGEWPGFMFWTLNGASAFVPLHAVSEFAYELRKAIESAPRPRPWRDFGQPAIFDELLRGRAPRPARARRLLHLSDLHFGTKYALNKQAMLEAELRDVVGDVDRVVITGDLFDSPKSEYATMYSNFKNGITHLAKGREPIVIPGNHDQRIFGNVGRFFEHIASAGMRKVVVDDDCAMTFTCFNSSERGSFARGKIPRTQFDAVGAEYRTILAARHDVKDYLPIVLVHHHPFSFDVKAETWVQRALALFGLRDETFLEMKDAADLHRWCADWQIRTILHGHKHQPRYFQRKVNDSNGVEMSLTAIGCGSSLGAEGSPVSYNRLDWDPHSKRWITSVFESVNGGAFKERLAVMSPTIPERKP